MLDKISHISIMDVKSHYRSRKEIHNDLVSLLQAKKMNEYVKLALGITNAHGNYSAAEHKLGPRILAENANSTKRVFSLGQQLIACQSVRNIPTIIYSAQLSNLKISVGSEMALMLRPNDFWVCNVRTVWAYLLIKHNWDYDKANEELSLYEDDDSTSEMSYNKWKEIFQLMEGNLTVLINLGNKYAKQKGIEPGKLKYLWADAIANALYEDDEDE